MIDIWTYPPSIEAWIDIGEFEDFPTNKLPGFTERLTAWLPSLVEHRCSYKRTTAAFCADCRKAPGSAMCWNTLRWS